MFRRLLSFFGLSWYVPNLPSGGGSDTSSPDTDGEATVSFAPGQKVGFSASEAEEAQDQRRAEITDNDLVWPGKVSEIGFANDAEVDYRYELTVTDLEPAYYTIRPPQGGKWHQDGGVLLQPGEETKYEVLFQSPPVVKSKSRTFSIVITRFDPRRSNDPGEVVPDGVLPTRWVAMPTAADFALTSKSHDVITRPWRRTALFAVDLANRSYLPPSLQLKILRAPKKDDLEKNADSVEQVGSFGQELESRRSGLFHFLAPALTPKGSYYATVKGTARVADKTEYAIGLTKPVHVRYVPWLRMGRDWLFLFGSVFLLLYIVWGIPVYKSPQVKLTVTFDGLEPGKLPGAGAQWANLKLVITPVGNGLTGQDINVPLQQTESQFTLPGGWYGYRPLLGWHGLENVKFRGITKLMNPDTGEFFTGYDIDDKPLQVSSTEDTISTDGGEISIELTKLAKKLPVFGDWIVTGKDRILFSKRIRVNISASGLGAAGPTVGILISGRLGSGSFTSMPVHLTLQGKQYVARDLPLNLPYVAADLLNITATVPTDPNLSASWLSAANVSFEVKTPYDVHLSFKSIPGATGPGSTDPKSGGVGAVSPKSGGVGSVSPKSGGVGAAGQGSRGPGTTNTGPISAGNNPAPNPEKQLAVEMIKTFKNLVTAVVSNQNDTVKDNAATASMSAAQAVINLKSGDVWSDRAYAILGYGYLQKTAIAPDTQKNDLAVKADGLINQTYDKEKSSNQLDSIVQLMHECAVIDKTYGEAPDKAAADAQQVRSDMKQLTTQSPSLEPFFQGFAYYYLSTVEQGGDEATKNKARKAFKTQGITVP